VSDRRSRVDRMYMQWIHGWWRLGCLVQNHDRRMKGMRAMQNRFGKCDSYRLKSWSWLWLWSRSWSWQCREKEMAIARDISMDAEDKRRIEDKSELHREKLHGISRTRWKRGVMMMYTEQKKATSILRREKSEFESKILPRRVHLLEKSPNVSRIWSNTSNTWLNSSLTRIPNPSRQSCQQWRSFGRSYPNFRTNCSLLALKIQTIQILDWVEWRRKRMLAIVWFAHEKFDDCEKFLMQYAD
jgi:hypothetical protein